jgi:hypothetical protein
MSRNADVWVWQQAWMGIATVLRRQTENERNKHEANGLFLFRRKDENLAACRLGSAVLRFHLGLTCSDRYFRRIFSS